MHIIVETKTGITKRKIMNFQIMGNEIKVNYKIGYTKTEKMVGSRVTDTYKAEIQSDQIKLSTPLKVTIRREHEVLYEYIKKERNDEK